MPTVDPLRVLNIDGTPYVVDNMSQEIQSVVEIYNEWRQKEVDARNDLLLVQRALADLGRTLVDLVHAEQEKAAEEAPQAAATTAPEPEVVVEESTDEPETASTD